MRASRDWVKRNLGFDPIATPAPPETFASQGAATRARSPRTSSARSSTSTPRDPRALAFFAFSTATGLSRFTDIPWPKRLAPKTGNAEPQGDGVARCQRPTCWS